MWKVRNFNVYKYISCETENRAALLLVCCFCCQDLSFSSYILFFQSTLDKEQIYKWKKVQYGWVYWLKNLGKLMRPQWLKILSKNTQMSNLRVKFKIYSVFLAKIYKKKSKFVHKFSNFTQYFESLWVNSFSQIFESKTFSVFLFSCVRGKFFLCPLFAMKSVQNRKYFWRIPPKNYLVLAQGRLFHVH
jgi:hypothetical protein